MADAVEAMWQDMEQEAANELVRRERHDALPLRTVATVDIGNSFQVEGNSMLKTPPRLAQDSRENPLPCPQWQSREAGSCLGAKRN